MDRTRTFDHIFPYRRWSTLEQGNSDRSSDERQRAITEAACHQNGWNDFTPIVDEGRSAFTGANLTKGNLGKLTTRLLTGAIEASKTVIVVEELDRLSRQPPDIMTTWMTPLLAAGLTIYVANTHQFITKETMREFGQFVGIMSQAFSAYEFSRKQVERGNGAWNKRRRLAAEGVTLSRHRTRGWLRWNDATRTYDAIPEKADIVQEIFDLRLGIAPLGKGAIAKLFNERARTDPRYRPFSSSKVQPKEWTTTAIGRILHDPAVTGYVQYHNHARGADKKVPVGDPVRVYPEIITPERFALANDERAIHQMRHQGRGHNVSNLLGPLARCGECGGVMQPLGSSAWKVNKKGERHQHYYLYCHAAKMTKGKACQNERGWSYAKVEKPLLDHLLRLAVDDQHFRADDGEAARLEGIAVRIARKLSDLKLSAERMFVAMGEQDAEDFEVAAYNRVKAQIGETRAELKRAQAELAEAKGVVSPKDHIVRVEELRARMDGEDHDTRFQARSLAKSALRGIIDHIIFFPGADPFGGSDGLVWAELIHGLGNLYIRPDGATFVESLDTRKNRSAASIAYAAHNADEKDRVEAYVRRRA